MARMSEPRKIDVRTTDGVAPCWIHRPEGEAKLPGVILYPDAGSVRDVMHDVAAKVASWGYVVLLPSIFYRLGDYPPFDPKTVFTDPPERDRLMTVVRSLDLPSAMRDAGHYLDALFGIAGAAGDRAGTMGYCIGGRLAFATAGAHPTRVAAAASVHGGGLVDDTDESPHLAAGKIEARLWFGIADEDGSCTPAHQAKLVEALATAHVRYSIDHFKGRKHGFAVRDFPVFDESAAGLHHQRVEELFFAAFKR